MPTPFLGFPHLTQCGLPSGVLIHPAVWPRQTWAEKWVGAAVPLSVGGAGSPSNIMWHGPRPTSIPSDILKKILIHSTVWPQYTNVTDRQQTDRTDRADNGLIRQHRANRFTNGRPIMEEKDYPICLS